jgi:hypothetical protein
MVRIQVVEGVEVLGYADFLAVPSVGDEVRLDMSEDGRLEVTGVYHVGRLVGDPEPPSDSPRIVITVLRRWPRVPHPEE